MGGKDGDKLKPNKGQKQQPRNKMPVWRGGRAGIEAKEESSGEMLFR